MGTTYSGAGKLETNYKVQQKIQHSVGATGVNHYAIQSPDAGAFGEVRRCIDTRTGEARAVKHIPKTDERRQQQVLHEIEMMRLVSGKHKLILKFLEYYEDAEHFDLVFEFCDKGNLQDAIQKQKLTSDSTALFCHQLLTAVSVLHSIGVMHRDVKPPNVLLKSDGSCVLGDFGTAITHKEPQVMYRAQGTPAFFSPEMSLLPKGQGYSFPVDVWAAGITLYEMFFKGEHPFMNGKRMDERLLRSAMFSVGWMKIYDPSAAELLRWLLMPAPWQRIKPADACNHGWFASHGLGSGSFDASPPTKMVPDSYGVWYEDAWT